MFLRLASLVPIALVPIVLWGVLPLVSGAATSPNELRSKIERKREEVQRRKGRERVLTSDISAYTRRITALQSEITDLQGRQAALQADLDAKRAELARLRGRLREQRMRLTRLRARLEDARAALAVRLVEIYKADKPDLITIVLESEGFAELLERTEFLRRISDQDRRIVDRVRVARADAKATAQRLDRLASRAEQVAAAIVRERDEVRSVTDRLVERRGRYASVRSTKRRVLSSVRADRQELETQLAALERENRRVEAALRRAQQRTASASAASDPLPAGPVRQGSGSLIWPVNGTITSPFGPRWGRLHAGLDIGAPEGTPIRAADGGKVVIAGPQGAYGNYTCVQHSASFSTCYAHQSRIGTSVGATVAQGDVIGYVGNTGRSFGAHLHFETRVDGTPADPLGYL